jgi:hypothetical protein
MYNRVYTSILFGYFREHLSVTYAGKNLVFLIHLEMLFPSNSNNIFEIGRIVEN